MNLRVFVVVLCAALSACLGPLQSKIAGLYTPGGLPLAALETVVLFVSTEVWQTDADKAAGIRVYSISNVDAVSEGFRDGFLAARPDAQLVVANEALRKACFESGTKSRKPSGAVLVIPDLGAAQCRALVDQLGIRYLISAAGRHLPTSTTVTELGVIAFRQNHSFSLVASAFDTKSGSSVCEESRFEEGESGAGAFLGPYLMPVPLVILLNKSSYWTRVGWYTGQKVGGCFVQPGETSKRD